MKLQEILVRSAHSALSLQAPNGAMPAGHNGPWRTPETPVRNTGYWLQTFIKAHEISGDTAFHSAAHAAADYLVAPANRLDGTVFFHREDPGKDYGNGLIGQAWSYEALLFGGTGLGREDMIDLAVRCFLAQNQDPATGLWRVPGAAGRPGEVCRTFNQQLWFASIGAELSVLAGNSEIRDRVERALRLLYHCAACYPSGVFEHVIRIPLRWIARRPREAVADTAARRLGERQRRPHQVQLAIGYHSFCLYALAMLKRTWPGHWLWRKRVIDRAIKAIDAPDYRNALDGNRYAFTYNPTGIENAFALEILAPGAASSRQAWLEEQFDRTWDGESGFLWKGSCDPYTAAARLYEASRLGDVHLSGISPAKTAPGEALPEAINV